MASPATAPLPRWFFQGFIALCLLSLAVLLASGLDGDSRWSFAARCDGRDAMTYYYAAWGLAEGLNPYDRAEILRHLNETPHFVYPVFAIPFFLPLVLVEPPTALVLFGMAHLVGFAALIAIWRRLLPVDWRLMALLLPMGFGATAVHDLCSSNVVTFEALALWLGIATLWAGRANRFAGWVALAAMPKLLWLALLPLALLRSRAAWRVIAAIAALAAVLFAAWLFLWPQTFWQWIANVRVTTSIRYNVFTALRTLDQFLGGDVGGALTGRWESWAYAFWIVLVVTVSALLLRRRVGIRSLSLYAPLALLCVWPGNLSYSWLIVLPSAIAVVLFLAATGRAGWALALAALCVLPQPLLEGMGLGDAFGQGTLVTVLVFWVALAGILLRCSHRMEAWLGGAQPPVAH